MTDRMAAYLLALDQRDFTLAQLALIAAALVAAWCLIDRLPAKYRPAVRRAYLVGGFVLYGLTLFVTVGRAFMTHEVR